VIQAQLESPLPASLPVGRATAVWCYGTCSSGSEPIERLQILVNGSGHRPAAWATPRFWATIPIEACDRPGMLELQLAVQLRDRTELTAPLGSIEVLEPAGPPSSEAMPEQPGDGLIAICMGTFDPDLDLFRAQLDSLRAQTDKRWICLISDDCSSSDRFEQIERAVAGDRRFVVSRSERRLGFYRNFERALELVPDEAELVALCDQDDRWYPEKLEVLRGALGGATLVYSDQRLVDAGGRVLRETFWKGRRNNHTNLASLLIANSITGAASLFRREVAERALPFPDAPGFQFHDHWLGLVALAMGDVAYVDRPLYDYTQHAGAVFGDLTTRPRLRVRRGVLGRWRAAYFYGYLGREVQAQVLLARVAGRLTARKRRVLERFVSSARSPVGFAWLATRPLRSLFGRNETLGSEAQLAGGILWRWLVALVARGTDASRWSALDARLPELGSFEQRRMRRWRAGAS
jgi:glycosyltransferase involved in cell wall biosynthesis